MTADKLSKFGSNFQNKTIACLLTDKGFLQQVADIMSPEFFDSEAASWIVKELIQYFYDFSTIPTLDVFKTKLSDLKEDEQVEIKTCLMSVYGFIESEDLEFVKEKSLEFAKNQRMKSAILKSVDLLNRNDYDAIKSEIDTALKSGSDRNVGHDYNAEVEFRYTEEARAVRPTPWSALNDITEGGFAQGELIVFAAPPGIGKSWALVNIGVHALKQGFNVVHYTLELSEAYTGRRYDANITGINSHDLKYHLDDIKDAVTKLPGKLKIKFYPNKVASCMTLRAHIEKMILVGERPDLVIVDYADRLRASRSGEVRHELEEIYDDLRGMAGEFGVPFFTASQINRDGAGAEIIEGTKISESFGKLMVADFLISLSRLTSDKLSGTGRWHVVKNRFGPDGITFPSKLNMSNGNIQIFEETTNQGQAVKKTMANSEEVTRQHLAQKFKELKSSSFTSSDELG